MPEDWRSAVTVPLYKGKGERTQRSSYRDISLLCVVGKIYAGIIVHRVLKVTEVLIDDKQGGIQSKEGLCRSDLHPKADRGESTGEKM